MKRVCHSGFDSILLQGTWSFHPSLVKVVYSEYSDLFVEVVVFFLHFLKKSLLIQIHCIASQFHVYFCNLVSYVVIFICASKVITFFSVN